MKEESYRDPRPAPEEPRGRNRKNGRHRILPAYRPNLAARIIGALVCLLFAAAVIYGVAQPGLIVTDRLCSLLRGLSGNGIWAVVPALLLAFFFLLFRRRRPVWGRMIALVLLPVVIGAFLHVLFTLPDTYGIGVSSFPLLWADGQNLDSGGVLGGFLGVSFTAWFGRIGGGAILVLLAILLLAGVFHITPLRLARMAARTGEYDDTEPYDDPDDAVPPAPEKPAETPLPEPDPEPVPVPAEPVSVPEQLPAAGGMFAGLRKKLAKPAVPEKRELPAPAEEPAAAPAPVILMKEPQVVPPEEAVPATEEPVEPASPVEEPQDEKLRAAAELALDAGQISEPMLQRRLKIDYGRACRLIDRLELLGLVGPAVGEKPRSILMTKQEWNEKENAAGGQPD